jgi:threonine dehydrogenase-like Zn-dependent dehydrogenase
VGAAATKKQSLQAVRPGGATVWIGLHEDQMSVDTYAITLPEKKVFGTYAATLSDLKIAVELMANNKVNMTSWVSTFPLDSGVEAFHGVLVPNTPIIKAVLLP